MKDLMDAIANFDFSKVTEEEPYYEILELPIQNDSRIKDIKINPHLTNDIVLLKKYYTLLLDYICELEERNRKLKKELERRDYFVQRRRKTNGLY